MKIISEVAPQVVLTLGASLMLFDNNLKIHWADIVDKFHPAQEDSVNTMPNLFSKQLIAPCYAPPWNNALSISL